MPALSKKPLQDGKVGKVVMGEWEGEMEVSHRRRFGVGPCLHGVGNEAKSEAGFIGEEREDVCY